MFLLQYGFHPGTTGVHFEAAARHRAEAWDIRAMSFGQSLNLSRAPYEGSLIVDSGIPIFQTRNASAPFPTAAYFIDVHLRLRTYVALAPLYDHVFVAQPDYLPAILAVNPRADWLPLACPTEFVGLRREIEFEVGFVGNAAPGSRRETVLSHLERHFVMNDWRRSYSTAEMGDVYRRSAVVVNAPVGDDLNMRFFEAMGAGAAVVSPRLKNGLPVVANEGQHYVTADFASLSDITDVVRSLLRSGADVIGRAGRELVASGHTYEHRMQSIVDAFGMPAAAPVRSMARRERARYLAAAANVAASSSLARESLRTEWSDLGVWKNATLAVGRASRRRYAARTTRRQLAATRNEP